MAITKRTRFEVLRRDEHTCQYCGAKAPDVTLQIDHVMPVALGGDDKPSNLVTACRDCNSGKSSIPPDSPLVQGLSEKAAAYALGMMDKMTRFRASIDAGEEFIEEFDEAWSRWNVVGTDRKIPLPADYELSLLKWSQMGIPFRVVDMAIPKAMKKPGLRGDDAVFQYLAGIVWNMVNERAIDYSVTQETAAVYTDSEMDEIRSDAYSHGYSAATARTNRWAELEGRGADQDFLTLHIDHWISDFSDRYREGGNPPWQENMQMSA